MTTLNEAKDLRVKVERALRMIDEAIKGKRIGELKHLAEGFKREASAYASALINLRGPVVPPPTDTKPH